MSWFELGQSAPLSWKKRPHDEALANYRRYVDLDPEEVDTRASDAISRLAPLLDPLRGQPRQYVSPSQLMNVRSGPGMEYDVQAVIDVGTEYRAIGRDSTGGWIMILYRGDDAWLLYSVTNGIDDLGALPVK